MGSCFLKFLSFFDCYKIPFNLLFENSTSYKTNAGAIVTLIIGILTLVFFVFMLVFLIKKKEENIITFDDYYPTVPKFTFYYDNNIPKYKKGNNEDKTFFLPMFLFYNTETNQYEHYDELSEIINSTVVLKMKGGDGIETEFEIKRCSEILSKDIDYKGLLSTGKIDSADCLQKKDDSNWDKSVTIQGKFGDEGGFKYLQIKFLPTNSEQIKTITDKYQIIVAYSEYSLATDKKNKAPLLYSLKQYPMSAIEGYTIETNFFVTLDEFKSKDNIFADWQKEHAIKLSRVNRIEKNVKALDGDTLLAVVFRVESSYSRYLRTYKTFFTLLAQLGGFWKVLVFIGSFITVVNEAMMLADLSDKLFNLIHPANNKEVNMTYKNYMKLEEKLHRPAPLLKSINPLLKQMAFSYYKYERNKGMNFTLLETFQRIFCKCLTSGTIAEKNEICNQSGAEIARQLDTKRIIKFSQQIKLIKKILLGDVESMILYLKNLKITYEELGDFTSEVYVKKAFKKYTPMTMTLYKQQFFIKGIANMKNQTDLSHKDVATLGLLNLERIPLENYFILYRKRLKVLWELENEETDGENKDDDSNTSD
ncbi:MAG: hypothetical protein MJ252_04625 [archaeon]|nr:hypothetical protein [archaeon]